MGAVPFGPRGPSPTAPVFPQVNNENVVKVGHRQVVNMIRQGGNHLVLKVVTVTRNLDPDDTARKKGARSATPPPLSSLLCLDSSPVSLRSALQQLLVPVSAACVYT